MIRPTHKTLGGILTSSEWPNAWCVISLVAFALGICWPVLAGRVPAALDTLSTWGPQALISSTKVHNPAIGDSALQYIPWQLFVRRSLQGGEWPLWDPDLFAGYPFLGNDQNQLYYPVAWLLLLFPLSGALQVGAVLHVFFAGLGMFILGRVLGLSLIGSLLAGLAFAGSGQLYTSIEMVGVSSIYVWLPYVLATAELALQRRSWSWAATSGLLLGVVAVSGHLPWFLYGGVFMIIWLFACLLAELIQTRKARRVSGEPGAVVEVGRAKWEFARQVARCAAILLLGPALAMVHLLPFLEAVSLSSRIQSVGLTPSNVSISSIPALLVSHLTLFVPRFYGTGLDGSAGPLTTFNNCWYVGLVAFALAFVALVLRHEWRVWLLGTVAVFSLCIALDMPFFNLVDQLPGLQQQIPERISYLFIVCTAVLVAYGYDAALKTVIRQPRAWLVMCLAVLVLGCIIGYALIRNRTSPESDPVLFKLQNDAMSQSAILGALVVTWMLALFSLRGKRFRIVKMALPLLVVLVAFIDLLTYFPGYNSYIAPANLSLKSAAADFMLTDPSLWRMMAIDDPKTVFPPDSSTYYGLHDAQGYDSLHLQRLEDYWAPVEPSKKDSPSNYFGVAFRPQNFRSNQAYLLNVKYAATYLPLLLVRQTQTNQDLGELADNMMAQSFGAPGKLSSVEFAFDTGGHQITSPITLRVRTAITDTQDLVTESLDPSGWHGLTWGTFDFAPLNTYKGEPLVALLEEPGATAANSVHVLGGNVTEYNKGELRLYQNGNWQKRSMAFVARALLPSDMLRGYENDIGVYTSTVALPRVFTVQRYQVAQPAKIPSILADKTFDPSKTVLLEVQPPTEFQQEPDSTSAQSAGTATVVSYQNLSVEIKADMQTKGWLVLCDVNYPGWTVEIDGQSAPLYTAYYILRAVPLEPGEHTVRFVFRPASVTIGGAVSVAALLTIAGIWLAGLFVHRKEVPPEGKRLQK